MNRKRIKGEDFETYHENMRGEASAIKEHLKGKMVHVSKQYFDGKPIGLGKTYKKPPVRLASETL